MYMVIGLIIGLLIGTVFHVINDVLYKKILVSKAEAYNTGNSNVEYILGEPYVISKLDDYMVLKYGREYTKCK